MAEFRSAAGKSIEVVDPATGPKKRKVVVDGVEYKRVGRPKYKSRATRLEEALDTVRAAVQRLEDVKGELENEGITAERFEELVNEAEGAAEDVSMGADGVGELRDEMTDWRDNIEEKFSQTSRFEMVSEAADTLDNAVSTLEGVSLDFKDSEEMSLEEKIEALTDAIQSAIDYAEEGIGEAEGVEFPGMYG